MPDVIVHAERPPDTLKSFSSALTGGLDASLHSEKSLTLASLPVGAHLILRCRKDWRDATIVAVSLEKITLSVGAPSGRAYRIRRPPDTLLSFEGSIPVLGSGAWRAGFVRYDARW